MQMFEAVQGFFDRAANRLHLDEATRNVLSTPRREVAVQVRVPMDDGQLNATGAGASNTTPRAARSRAACASTPTHRSTSSGASRP